MIGARVTPEGLLGGQWLAFAPDRRQRGLFLRRTLGGSRIGWRLRASEHSLGSRHLIAERGKAGIVLDAGECLGLQFGFLGLKIGKSLIGSAPIFSDSRFASCDLGKASVDSVVRVLEIRRFFDELNHPFKNQQWCESATLGPGKKTS